MSSLEERMATLEESTRNFEKTADEIKIMLGKFIDESPKKYAGKWVEVVLITVIAGLMLFLFTARPQQLPQMRQEQQPLNSIHLNK